ncbi:unnamed protein product [Sphagnum jensenii]|uniref:Uncharacterized protein n=1 Tax=Sphagnum jensenii TaxID=128206 RepID=A0ABP1BPP4_9BRYO
MNVRKKKVAKRLLRSCTRPVTASSDHGSGDVHPWNSGTRAGSNGVCFLGRVRNRGLRPRVQGHPVIVSKANPISTSLVSLLRVCAALELIFSLLLLLFKAQLGSSQTVVNARNYALRLLTLLLLRIGFFPLFWSILSICSSRLVWSYVCYNMKNSLSSLQFGFLAVLNYVRMQVICGC